MTTYTVDHAGTHYVMHVADFDHDDLLIAVETGWGSNYGQWIVLPPGSVAWNYIAEKMPGMREGDKPGYKLLFAKAGVEIFG